MYSSEAHNHGITNCIAISFECYSFPANKLKKDMKKLSGPGVDFSVTFIIIVSWNPEIFNLIPVCEMLGITTTH